MAVQSFDFKKGKVVDNSGRKAFLSDTVEPTADLLNEVLRKSRYQIVGTSSDLRQLMEWLRKHKAGVLFLDMDIAAFNALEVMAQVKETYPMVNIVLSASAVDKDTLGKAVALGASGFIVKPYDKDAILKIIERVSG